MEMLLMVKVVLQVILMFVAWRFIIKLGDWTEDILSTLRDILEELKKGTDKKETEKKILKD